MSENNLDVGSMHIEVVIPPQKPREGVVIPRLSHGSKIVTIETGSEDLADCDAVITSDPKFPLGVTTADCAAICFSDHTKIGIAHVGWRGLAKGLVEKMLERFDPTTLSTYVGPLLNSFEIQRDSCYEQIVEKFGEQFIEKKEGKRIFNFKDAIASVLPSETVYDARDTATDPSLPSHRRNGTRDRIATIVSFRTT